MKHLKWRILPLLLAVLCVFTAIPVVAEDAITVKINRVNQDRGADMIVLYNTSGTTTNTNEWGREVTVTNGIVTSVSGYNNTVPNGDDSYVVSGHGKGETALSAVKVGMTAVYNASAKTVTFREDAERDQRLLDQARSTANIAKTAAYEGCYIVAEDADARFAAAEKQYETLKKSFDSEKASALAAEYDEIAILYRDRAAAEYRGVWIRPMQKNMQEVEQFVRECKKAGLNMISVEALISGTTIYPTPSGSDFTHNPMYEGFDVLGAFVEMGKKYGIEIHVWMHTFSLGDKGGTYESIAFATKHPEWRIRRSNGRYDDTMLDPVYDELQEMLIEHYRYILETYDIDGFELDTIRYPNVEAPTDWGYSTESIARFKKAYPKYANMTITYNENASYWQDWVTFRADNVSRMVKRVRDLIDEVRPDVLLSADVGAATNQTRTSAYQDSRRWVEEGWLDILHPMAYGENDDIYVENIVALAGDETLIVPALGAWVDGWDAETMLDHSNRMLNIGCRGVEYFANEGYFGKNCDDRMLETLFTEASVSPGLNLTNTAVADLQRFADRVDMAAERGLINGTAKKALSDAVLKVIDAIKATGTVNAVALLDAVEAAAEKQLSDGSLLTRLNADIENARWAIETNVSVKDTYQMMSVVKEELSDTVMNARILTIDKIDSVHKGEDGILITDPAKMANYEVNWTQVLLLKPVTGTVDRYVLVEAHHHWGEPYAFTTALTDGMLVASFHTTEGSGKDRHDLSQTFPIGTEFVLYGVDVKNKEFTSLNAMLYVYNDNIANTGTPDVSEISMKLPLKMCNVPHAGDDSILITDPAKIADYTVNWTQILLLEPVKGSSDQYRIVESFHNWGEVQPFQVPIIEGMIAASFHSVGVAEAQALEQLAGSLQVGTVLTLFGVDTEKGVLTSSDAMLYIPKSVWMNPFTDVTMNDSYYESVKFVYQNGLFKGVSDSEFAPAQTMTRAMFVTVLGRLEGIDTSAYTKVSFGDVKVGEWYAPYVEWAASEGIVLGYGDGKFGVNDTINVEQAAVIMARYAAYAGIDTKSTVTLKAYSDASAVSDWAKLQMTWMTGVGLYNGEDGMLNPKAPAKRSLVAEIMCLYTTNIK